MPTRLSIGIPILSTAGSHVAILSKGCCAAQLGEGVKG
jgi:hypothetical protein